jgi:hypothetical protein
MIKSNGFSITLASPEKDRHGNKLTEKNRSENKYRMGSNTVRYNISEDRNNVTFNLNLSPDPYKKE